MIGTAMIAASSGVTALFTVLGSTVSSVGAEMASTEAAAAAAASAAAAAAAASPPSALSLVPSLLEPSPPVPSLLLPSLPPPLPRFQFWNFGSA
jgi:hypothetical protein